MTKIQDQIINWCGQEVEIDTGAHDAPRFARLSTVGKFGIMVRERTYVVSKPYAEEETFIPWTRINTIKRT